MRDGGSVRPSPGRGGIAGVGRSVGSGGRYDQLLKLYGLDRPAVGVALETDILAELLA